MENYIKSQVSAEEFAFLQTLGKHPDLSPAIISQLLSVYDSLKREYSHTAFRTRDYRDSREVDKSG